MNLDNIIDINYDNNVFVSGLTDSFFGFYLYNLLNQKKSNIYVVVNTLYEANVIYDNTSAFTDNVLLFPMDDFLTSEAIAMSPDLLISRMETIKKISNESCNIVITNLMGFLRFLPTKDKYLSSILNLKKDYEISPKLLCEKLVKMGYQKESIVTNTGEFASRGFVVDIFPLGDDYPVRVEFFGDYIDSIRYFDSGSQKSINSIDNITIYPYFEFLCDDEIDDYDNVKQKFLPSYSRNIVSLYDYLDNPILVYRDYGQLEVGFHSISEQVFSYHNDKDVNFNGKYMFDLDDISSNRSIYYSNINNVSKGISVNYDVMSVPVFNEDVSLINKYIRENNDKDYTILICVKKNQFRNIIKNLNMKFIESSFDNVKIGSVNLVDLPLNEGFVYKNVIFLSQKELFLNVVNKKKYKTKFKYSTKITDLNKLVRGDYVVHLVHGIGIYNGIKDLEFNGVKKDYIEVLYRDKDKLYIPVEKIDSLSKFSGKEGYIPKVNKLGGTEWAKTKARVGKKICDMANDLLKLYAERENKIGFAFSKDTDMQKSFELDFPYDLTPDQNRAIAQVKSDMESSHPMDRLLCGDVGFGKTEVAFVAAFKAIMDSKQVFLLCPTTILSNQHYKNALVRFKNYPVNIKLFNRFTSYKESNAIIDGIKNGTVDFVIGTHRLLNSEILPKDLGLLIIDEEQRFGVKHKEKIKQYKNNVDVLTLSATPIPRTLQMSMTGIRSLSLIETPPVDRYPVQTYVVEENKMIIKDAIYKELSRGGQVFILYNKVVSIEKKVSEIERLIPDARIIYAHGQMNKSELENRMLSFINHEYDILICTTIIETGIDIPNVNTLIILDADHFGLSQLYQIRGRVGRSNKFAYAYLMYEPFKSLTESAIKRLNVIKEFTELGSGFSIATRDLSIRGAGDILGSEQAGFMDSIGVDLYLQMLNDEVNRRNGKVVDDIADDDFKPLLSVNTHIKNSYVDDENLKIEIHRLINSIDSSVTFDEVKDLLEDRFGKIDSDMDVYMHEEWFEKQAHDVHVKSVRETKNYIEILFDKESVKNLDVESLFVSACKITNMFRFQMRGSNLVIILDTVKLDKHPVYYLVSLFENLIKK